MNEYGGKLYELPLRDLFLQIRHWHKRGELRRSWKPCTCDLQRECACVTAETVLECIREHACTKYR